MKSGLLAGLLLLVVGASPVAAQTGYSVIITNNAQTYKGPGVVSVFQVTPEGQLLSGSGDYAYGVGLVVDSVMTDFGYATLNNQGEVYLFKHGDDQPVRRYAVPEGLTLLVTADRLLIPRSNGYVYEAIRTKNGLKALSFDRFAELQPASLAVTDDQTLVTYTALDRRVAVYNLLDGKFEAGNSFELDFSRVLSISIARNDLFILSYEDDHSTTSRLWRLRGISQGTPTKELLSDEVPINPQFGGGNILSAVYANDGSLAVFALLNREQDAILGMFRPGLGWVQVANQPGPGIRHTSVKAYAN